jgi:DNA-binding MarR family transcriptional regulator
VDHVEAVRTVVRLSRTFERACGELHLAHYRVLAAVAEGERRASHVAERLALGKPAISASVDALCRRGLLIRKPSESDQRVLTLALTPAGERLLAQTEKAMLERLDAVLEHVADPRAAVAALAQLGGALDELAAERFGKGAR